MGYVKSGSQKSLAAGGLSALALLCVYSELPVRPAFASVLGLGKRSLMLLILQAEISLASLIWWLLYILLLY